MLTSRAAGRMGGAFEGFGEAAAIPLGGNAGPVNWCQGNQTVCPLIAYTVKPGGARSTLRIIVLTAGWLYLASGPLDPPHCSVSEAPITKRDTAQYSCSRLLRSARGFFTDLPKARIAINSVVFQYTITAIGSRLVFLGSEFMVYQTPVTPQSHFVIVAQSKGLSQLRQPNQTSSRPCGIVSRSMHTEFQGLREMRFLQWPWSRSIEDRGFGRQFLCRPTTNTD